MNQIGFILCITDLSSRTDTPIDEINLLGKGPSFCPIPRDIKGASHNSMLTVQMVLFVSIVQRQKQFRINRQMDEYH